MSSTASAAGAVLDLAVRLQIVKDVRMSVMPENASLIFKEAEKKDLPRIDRAASISLFNGKIILSKGPDSERSSAETGAADSLATSAS
jgi:hypothetical protein